MQKEGTHEQLALHGRGIRAVGLQRVGGGGELPRHFLKLSTKPLVVLSELHSGTRTMQHATLQPTSSMQHRARKMQQATTHARMGPTPTQPPPLPRAQPRAQ